MKDTYLIQRWNGRLHDKRTWTDIAETDDIDHAVSLLTDFRTISGHRTDDYRIVTR